MPDDELPVLGDRAMLHRALLNLVTNAVKFSHDGGVVEVSRDQPDGRHDRGRPRPRIGIPAAEIDRLGTRFFRASNAVRTRSPAPAWGSASCRRSSTSTPASWSIESVEGEGTTVTVRMPGRRGGRRAGRGPPAAGDARLRDYRLSRSEVADIAAAGSGSRLAAGRGGRPGD